MARFTIKSRNQGNFTFFVPDAGGYVRLESDSNSGTTAQQICHGGRFSGGTILAAPDTLERVAHAWYSAFRARARDR